MGIECEPSGGMGIECEPVSGVDFVDLLADKVVLTDSSAYVFFLIAVVSRRLLVVFSEC